MSICAASPHSPEPKYHYEVHSVRHSPERYATAEQKLQAVVRQAAAVEHQLRNTDDDVQQMLIDDSEHHNERLQAAKKKSPRVDKEHDAPRRHRLEQLRHLEDEKDELGELQDDSEEDYDGYEYRPSLQQLAEDVKPAEKVSVEVRVDQNEAAAAANGESAQQQQQQQPASAVVVGNDGSTAQKMAEEVQHNDAPAALPLQDTRGQVDEGSAVNAVGSASSIADIYFLGEYRNRIRIVTICSAARFGLYSDP